MNKQEIEAFTQGLQYMDMAKNAFHRALNITAGARIATTLNEMIKLAEVALATAKRIESKYTFTD